MKTDDELLTLWTGAGGAFAGDPAAQTAMMPREQLVVFLRTLVDTGAKTPVDVLRDESLISDEMLICEVRERNLEDEFDGVEIYGYDEVEAEAMCEFICKLAGKIA